MSRRCKISFTALLALFTAIGASQLYAQRNAVSQIGRTVAKLKSLDKDLDEPKPGEWLATQRETGQTFRQYVQVRPNVLTRQRNTLYVQQIGELNETEQKLVDQTAEYLSVYFNCPVKRLPKIDSSQIPDNARREFPGEGQEQWLTGYILEKILAPTLPEDAFATIAFTRQDLWPGEGWNYVFGYAAFRDRVGVWSVHRFGDPESDEASYQKCLQRTIKLATHETGHMFSMKHCTAAACNMQGSNSLPESDSQPMHLCSQCHAKVLYATGSKAVERLKKLKQLCEKHGFESEVEYYSQAIERLGGGS